MLTIKFREMDYYASEVYIRNEIYSVYRKKVYLPDVEKFYIFLCFGVGDGNGIGVADEIKKYN